MHSDTQNTKDKGKNNADVPVARWMRSGGCPLYLSRMVIVSAG